MDAGVAAILSALIAVVGTVGVALLGWLRARSDREERNTELEAARVEQRNVRWLETRRVAYAQFMMTLRLIIDSNYARLDALSKGGMPGFPRLAEDEDPMPTVLTELQDRLCMIELVGPTPIGELARSCFDFAYDVEMSVRGHAATLSAPPDFADREDVLRFLGEKCDPTLDLYFEILDLMKADLRQ
ncbi:hypothetical protein ACO229_07120 [Promicromonospora sp. MS192]|uniref:hypothetical protein n=1 Tax=Promicromonospora sp. MS192 TaxID=3412684 RepID=UPI003C2BFD9F